MGNINYQQKHKRMSLKTTLGEDKLLLVKMMATEGFSSPFVYQLTCLTTETNLAIEQLIGESVSISIATGQGDEEYYHGIVSDVAQDGLSNDGFNYYYLTVRPWLWWLNFSENCRIYQDKTVIDIISDIFKAYPNHSYDVSKVNRSNYVNIPYCVQYNETDLHFIQRLLSHYGIFYYFLHSSDQHQLILADSNNAYQAAVGEALAIHANQPGFDEITQWQHQFISQPGKISYNSHDFTNPDAKLLTSTDSLLPLKNNASYERYRYAGDYSQVDCGTKTTRVTMEAYEAGFNQVMAKATSRRLRVGRLFSIDQTSFPNEKETSFVVKAIDFDIEDLTYVTSSVNPLKYQNNFVCLPKSQVYRELPNYSKPVIQGVQEAIITGPNSEEIYTDQYGRYKVYFYWDRINQPNEKSSCWVRASQHWHGIFRVGTPVIVGFLNGDIDQPIILGPVDDARQMPLFPLTDNNTKSGIKRRPGTNDNDQHYNYISFEDKEDNELLEIYAGKDLSTTIENKRDVLLNEGSDSLTINKGDLVIAISEGQYVLSVKKDVCITANGDISLKADGNINLQAGREISIQSGTAMNLTSGTNLSQSANTNIDLNAEAQLKIQSAMADISADGILSMKGSLIKEN